MSGSLWRSRWLLALAACAAVLAIAACELHSLLPRGSAARSVTLPSPLPPQTPDPPARVFRISALESAVSLRPAGIETWARAELNRPVAQGDALWTDTAARAELDLGSMAIRMDSRTGVDFLKFDDHMVQARVVEGVIGITVRRLASEDIVEFDTPNVAVTILQPGVYRLEIQRATDTTFATVRSGSAEISGTHLEFTLNAGQQVNIAGADAVEYGLQSAAAFDKFDAFCDARDRREARSTSGGYVHGDMIGAAELSESGSWRMDTERGAVWTPSNLPPGWAPFRFGHWVWMHPWGWTWIDDVPWGFAPFHYGRWFSSDGKWSWMPGPRDLPPVYAPALVTFAGGGRPGFRYFFWIGGSGSDKLGIAWFPIGPNESYVPSYCCSVTYKASINGANEETPNDDVRRLTERSVTMVPREAFIRGEPVGAAARTLPKDLASNIVLDGTTPPVAPTEASLAPRRHRYVPLPPKAAFDTVVVGRHDPPPQIASFREMLPFLQRHPGRPLDPAELEGLAVEGSPNLLVRSARLGAFARKPIAPPLPVRSAAEIARDKNEDARRLDAIRVEQRRAERASDRSVR